MQLNSFYSDFQQNKGKAYLVNRNISKYIVSKRTESFLIYLHFVLILTNNYTPTRYVGYSNTNQSAEVFWAVI